MLCLDRALRHLSKTFRTGYACKSAADLGHQGAIGRQLAAIRLPAVVSGRFRQRRRTAPDPLWSLAFLAGTSVGLHQESLAMGSFLEAKTHSKSVRSVLYP